MASFQCILSVMSEIASYFSISLLGLSSTLWLFQGIFNLYFFFNISSLIPHSHYHHSFARFSARMEKKLHTSYDNKNMIIARATDGKSSRACPVITRRKTKSSFHPKISGDERETTNCAHFYELLVCFWGYLNISLETDDCLVSEAYKSGLESIFAASVSFFFHRHNPSRCHWL